MVANLTTDAGLLDQFGHVLPKTGKARAGALISGSVTPYDAADWRAPEFEGWSPWLGSGDGERAWGQRDTAVARIRDTVRNDAVASGVVDRITDATVGPDLRLMATPDWQALAHYSGNSAFDAKWAREFTVAAEAGWRSWAYDPGHYCDRARRQSFGSLVRLAFRNLLVEGEALAVLPWKPERIGYGRARFATCLQLIDPDRLSNPANAVDTMNCRGGVEINADGEIVAFHIREAHMNDWWAAGQSLTWDRVPAETEFGRKLALHYFNQQRPGQHRPIGGILVPVLGRLKMLNHYSRVELQAAVVNSIFSTFITSPYDHRDVQESLEDDEGMSRYQELRNDFHRNRQLMAGNVRVPTLFPGENITAVDSKRPNTGFDAFESAMLRSIATALGVAYETISSDYRGSTYSSARQASNEAWLTLTRRRHEFSQAFCTPIYAAILEELFDRDELPLPAGAPDFALCRGSYARAHWSGPGRGFVDPVKEAEGAKSRISAGLSTLQAEVQEATGRDWEQVIEQLALEKKVAEDAGLTLIFDSTAAQAGLLTPADNSDGSGDTDKGDNDQGDSDAS